MTEDKNTDGTIVQFLLGSHSYNGKWYMEHYEPGTPSFWWRPILREYIEQQSPVSEEVKTEGKAWQEILRIMRDCDLLDDKYDSQNLNFIYAFQMGFRAASIIPPTPSTQTTNEQTTNEIFNSIYNQAIEHATAVIWKNRFIYTGVADMVEQLQSLVKPS